MTQEVEQAYDALMAGGVIAYPTDTIWGLGCLATNAEAVSQIYRIKQRAESKKCIVLIQSLQDLPNYFDHIPEAVYHFESNNPTTFILPHAKNLAPNLIAEDGSQAFRIPNDPFCQALLEKTGLPIVSTSANISGEPSPGNYNEISNEILQEVNYVVNLRREDTDRKSPSSIILFQPDGHFTQIR